MSVQAPVRRPGHATHQVARTAARLGLWAPTPRRATHPHYRPHPRYHAAHANRGEMWARVDEAVRLLLAPGPAYFVSSLVAGMAAAFLVGLWLL
jgi:hypothetical protein